LSASIDNIINSNLNILDIAILYGFEYEQTYIRSFKREFGITPGDLRKTGKILTIKPPLNLFDSNKMADGAFFGPDIVMVPQFHVIGRKYKMPLYCELSSLPTFHFNNFINEEKNKIADAINSEIIINISIDNYMNNNQNNIFNRYGTTIDIFDPTSFGGSYKSWQWLKPVKFPA